MINPFQELLLYTYLGTLIFVLIVLILIRILIWIFGSPFKYPYKIIEFDISGKRSPQYEDLIDRYIIENGITIFLDHYEYVKRWKQECQDKIAKCRLKRRRQQQYLKCIDDEHMFRFNIVRSQTRYRQSHYQKFPYHVKVIVSHFSKDISYLEQKYNDLDKIGFECTIAEYETKDQRKRMTKALRNEIMVRDSYTCQICGKYMPDEVGLHIDHIKPIAKGGKSVPSNLQVLCSKCNGKKSKN